MAKYKGTPDQRAAQKAVSNLLALGKPRHNNKDSGRIHSVSTANQYRQIYTRLSAYCRENDARLVKLKPETAEAYLLKRSSEIQDKQLNNERRAMEIHLRRIHKDSTIKLSRIKSTRSPPEKKPRAYSPEQVRHLLKTNTDDRLSLSTKLTYTGGLRVHELLTVERFSERQPSGHREWSNNKFIGTQREQWIAYTVSGKGGLVREVRFPPHLAQQLEEKRLSHPITVIDREGHHTSHYNLLGGQKFTKAFEKASMSCFNYSNGPHGLRHSYAQERMFEIQNMGKSYKEAKAIVSQELGHFREDVTEEYLR